MKILIIDDEPTIRLSLKVQLGKIKGAEILTASTGEEGCKYLDGGDIALALIDINLPKMGGLAVLKHIIDRKIPTVTIMITYLSEARLAVQAMKMGAYDYFTKPFSLDEVLSSVKNGLNFSRKKEIQGNLEEQDLHFIGESSQILNIKRTLQKIATSGMNTNILVEGESGTGKEMIPRYLHHFMGKDTPFLPLNCSAIPTALQESELFGYEKSAFTDAKEQKKGLLEKSNGGVLFLDEIGDMPIELQAKLLRVLESKKFRRVGGIAEVDFDAMVVAATNKNLREQVNLGLFRKDLLFRLNIIPLKLPPLRQRKEDIPLLIAYFLQFYQSKTNTSIQGISEEAQKIMEHYDWDGNVRELKNTIERIMILSDNHYILPEDLPMDIFAYTEEEPEVYDLDQIERNAITNCLKKNNYNITQTADELGITRTTLRNKINRYQISVKHL